MGAGAAVAASGAAGSTPQDLAAQTVLILEFAPVIFDRFNLERLRTLWLNLTPIFIIFALTLCTYAMSHSNVGAALMMLVIMSTWEVLMRRGIMPRGKQMPLLLIMAGIMFSARVRKAPVEYHLLRLLSLVVNRLGVSMVGYAVPEYSRYYPAWSEIMITVGIFSAGLFVMRLAMHYLPIYEEHHSAVQAPTRPLASNEAAPAVVGDTGAYAAGTRR